MHSSRFHRSESRVSPGRLLLGLILIALAFWILATDAHAQSLTPALLTAPIEFGVGYATGKSDYTSERVSGPTGYVNVNILKHYAVVANFHHLSTSDKSVTENTFSGGFRVHSNFGPVTPYIEAIAGEGLLHRVIGNQSGADSSIVTGGGGGGELSLPKRFALRADFEYQRWLPVMGFDGLNAHFETFGLTYRIAPGYGRER